MITDLYLLFLKLGFNGFVRMTQLSLTQNLSTFNVVFKNTCVSSIFVYRIISHLLGMYIFTHVFNRREICELMDEPNNILVTFVKKTRKHTHKVLFRKIINAYSNIFLNQSVGFPLLVTVFSSTLHIYIYRLVYSQPCFILLGWG